MSTVRSVLPESSTTRCSASPAALARQAGRSRSSSLVKMTIVRDSGVVACSKGDWRSARIEGRAHIHREGGQERRGRPLAALENTMLDVLGAFQPQNRDRLVKGVRDPVSGNTQCAKVKKFAL